MLEAFLADLFGAFAFEGGAVAVISFAEGAVDLVGEREEVSEDFEEDEEGMKGMSIRSCV